MANQIFELKPTQETYAKATDAQAGTLPENKKFLVTPKPLYVDHYDLTTDGKHIRVHLVTDKGVPYEEYGKEVFVYGDHFEPVKPSIIALQNTFIKLELEDSSKLPDDKKIWLPQGTQALIKDVGDYENQHVKLWLPDGREGYVFLGDWDNKKDDHVLFVGSDPENHPDDTPSTNPEQRKKQKVWYTTAVPGISKLNMYDPIDRERAPNIYWYEALHFSGSSFRKPSTTAQVQGMIAIAREVQKVRNHYKRSIIINSFFRPEPYNSKAGGARFSWHKKGSAVDYNVSGVSPHKVRAYIESTGFKGGLANSSVFAHQDTGPNRRWNYPF